MTEEFLPLLQIYKVCKNISPPAALATLNVKTSQIRSGCLEAPVSSRHFTVQCQFNFCDEARTKEGRLLYLYCMCMSFYFCLSHDDKRPETYIACRMVENEKRNNVCNVSFDSTEVDNNPLTSALVIIHEMNYMKILKQQ